MRKYEEQLKGAAKILDNLWDGCIPSMGERAAERLRTELEYYFGKNWSKNMYDFLGDEHICNKHAKPLKTLREILKRDSN